MISNLITNFINGWALYMPGNPFLALAVLVVVGCISLIGFIWSINAAFNGTSHGATDKETK